jgi:hypothetical protein
MERLSEFNVSAPNPVTGTHTTLSSCMYVRSTILCGTYGPHVSEYGYCLVLQSNLAASRIHGSTTVVLAPHCDICM